MAKREMEPHDIHDCPFLHVKKCPGCGKSCACYTRSKQMAKTKMTLSALSESTLSDLTSGGGGVGFKIEWNSGGRLIALLEVYEDGEIIFVQGNAGLKIEDVGKKSVAGYLLYCGEENGEIVNFRP